MSIPIANVIAALRDTAGKVNEQVVENRVVHPAGDYGFLRDEIQQFSTERYSKDWIAGRLIGMADILEAVEVKP